jgi:hypothetical protein
VVKEHIKNAKRSLIQREKKILIIGSVSKHGRLIDVRLHNLESLHKNNHKYFRVYPSIDDKKKRYTKVNDIERSSF